MPEGRKASEPVQENGPEVRLSDQRDPADFLVVLKEELTQIKRARASRGRPDFGGSHDVWKTAHEASLLGLAFSGGGIRSATFHLGVLQGLAELHLLLHFDYLSSVSGGSYIAGWLAALIRERGKDKQNDNAATLRVEDLIREGTHDPLVPEPPPLQHVRKYSNYLTPRL